MMLAYGASNLVVAGWARQGTGNLRFKTAYRTYVSQSSGPGPWTAISTAKTPSQTSAAGEFADTQSLTGIGGVMWIQGGLQVGLSAAGPGEAEVSFQCFAESSARIIAAQRIQVQPDINTTRTAIIPLGAPFPSLGLTGAMVAGTINGVTGTLLMNFVLREFTFDMNVPGAWGTGMITQASISVDGDYNSGNMPITPAAGKAYAQIGVAIPANDARATLEFTLAVKY